MFNLQKLSKINVELSFLICYLDNFSDSDRQRTSTTTRLKEHNIGNIQRHSYKQNLLCGTSGNSATVINQLCIPITCIDGAHMTSHLELESKCATRQIICTVRQRHTSKPIKNL